MVERALLATAMLVASIELQGCGTLKQTPAMYSTYFTSQQDALIKDVPTGVKPSFVAWLGDNCQLPPPPPKLSCPPNPTPTSKSPQPDPANPTLACRLQPYTDYPSWASQNRLSHICAYKVIKFAADQCITKVGQQNRFSAYASLAFGTLLSAGGVASIYAAAANAASNTKALAGAAAVTAAGNVDKIVPSAASVKVSDVTGAGQSYVLINDMNDENDFYPCGENNMHRCVKPEKYINYSRLHDAAYAVCPTYAF